MDLARPRQPFSLYQQRGSGQLLFDIGVAGDFVGNITQRNVARAGGGTFAGQENRFFPREVELSLFGQIDPYASAVVRIEAGEEGRGQETGVTLAEAYLTLLTLPFGTQARLGQVRNRFGWSNEIHEHDLPWVDRPNVMRNFLGGEGLQEKGVELTLVPDLPFYIEALAGIFNGDNETALGRRRPLRLVAVPDQSRLGVGDRAVRLVLAVGVSPLSPGVQAHRPQPANPRRLQPERLERPEGRRAPLPGHLHPRRPPGASLLGGDDSCDAHSWCSRQSSPR